MDFSKLHIINVAKDGTFASKGPDTTPRDVDAIFDYLDEKRLSHLLLYFHGGLVPEDRMRASAEQGLLAPYKDEARTHPVFWIWETDLPRVLSDNLHEIGQDTVYRRVFDAVARVVGSKLRDTGPISFEPGVGEETLLDTLPPEPSVAVGPVSAEDEAELETILAGDQLFLDEVDAIAAAQEASPSFDIGDGDGSRPAGTRLSPEVLGEMQQGDDSVSFGLPLGLSFPQSVLVGGAVGILRRVVARLRDGTHHGTHATISEEILRALFIGPAAAEIWKQMKRDAHQAFDDNHGLSGQALHGGTYFLETLRAYVARHPELKVSLVGHSAGSIYISEMLLKAAAMLPGFKFHQIVFLAPGVDFELFKRAVVDQPEMYRAFRMFALSDELEKKDILIRFNLPPDGAGAQRLVELGGVYPSSLLYFVSGLLEEKPDEPIVGMQRFFREPGASPHQGAVADAVRDFMAAQDIVVWSAGREKGNPAPGLACWAESHGGFGDEPKTLESIVCLLTA